MSATTNHFQYQQAFLSNGRKVNYTSQGEGEAVVLTHGFAASLHDWDDLLPELSAAGYAGYAIDLLGHGESAKPNNFREYSVEAMYEDFSAWIDSLNLASPFTLVGHSLGGGLSMLYANRNPHKVKALTLINPFYSLKQLSFALQTVFQHQLVKTSWIEHTPYLLFRFMVEIGSYNAPIGAQKTHRLPQHIRRQTALDYKRAASGIYNIPYTLQNVDLDFSRVTQPTLLLWGGHDSTLSPSSFPQLKAMLPNLKAAHEFPVCGHTPHQCHPAELNPYVMEFLRTA
ncbi:MAG: alpha/beta hydrolase [Anaerolineales bacterium]|nr:alpha/beta hydrolase [Anaerolineales bacterium]